MESSPPPFIVFYPAKRIEVAQRVYERSLELAGLVHKVLEQVPARHHHRNLLDRGVTFVTMETARAASAIRVGRWRYYREALKFATDCATILDILDRQNPELAGPDLLDARRVARLLMLELAPLTISPR